MLTHPTIDQLVKLGLAGMARAFTELQEHTVRGVMAGALKKRLGLTIVSEKVEGRGRVYRSAG